MNEALNEKLVRLIATIDLSDILPVELHSARLGDGIGLNEELQMDISLAFADGDPAQNGDMLIFRPKYDLVIKKNKAGIFRQTTKFIVTFRVKDAAGWESVWSDAALQELFKSRQINKLLWPFFRQQVIDGMTRVGLPPVTLKWIV